MNRRKNETRKLEQIATERITILLTRADAIYSNEPLLAQRYGDLARKIAMKARVPIPTQWQLRFCNKCKKFLYPGSTAHVRIKSGKPSRVVYYCDICKVGKKLKMLQK
ncbi:MAG: ribonuclease P [Candidatus Heimdallarchaeota archaeon]|nr:ribonuclease P [Candidatus Heimdallarchaeota archaeon]